MIPRIKDIEQVTLLRNGFNLAKQLPQFQKHYARGIVSALTGLAPYQCDDICRDLQLQPGDPAKDQTA